MHTRKLLTYKGSAYFRQRILMATLSGRPVRFESIRSDDDNPGLRDFEVSFLRLIEKVTNGSVIDISYTGKCRLFIISLAGCTAVLYRPGTISGGKIKHECPTSRAIGYYLEPLIGLAPFAKNPIVATFTGITSNNTDISVDTIRTVTLANFKHFGLDTDVELKITKRGSSPLGGGEVRFICPTVRLVKPIQVVDQGRIKRIRGISFSTRVSPQTANRMVESARGVLNPLIPDIYIYTDVYKGADAGLSPGYGITLVAESTTGALMSAELMGEAGDSPEDIGQKCAKQLLSEVEKGGCFDSMHQWIAFLFMVLSTEDVSKTRIGRLSSFSMQFLRDLQDFFNVTFKIKPDTDTNTILMSCVGVGYVNTNKKMA
ncbi:hypothetical protein EV182_000075 [Spiromyces aspiralis]|uniref:Uncharacterized protein n=1 Tax=Spiromyces aspiralis TaxID=68401 RepID=A0ACC1HUY8_9FUNG|nr:hypothetical protein EV182_000075 [Spiromyces aspiralis]